MENERIQYCILDPTGNVTALVESPVEISHQPSVARKIMQQHPETEQVGFFSIAQPSADTVQASLRMAGGEFCGNASGCAAALYLMQRDPEQKKTDAEVWLKVSGAGKPVKVSLHRESAESFLTCVTHPAAQNITGKILTYGSFSETLPVIQLEGITHIIIRPDSVFSRLRENCTEAEQALREWCAKLGADCLGLMFPQGNQPELRMTPFVYVPGSDTFFRENSCASGSAALGMYLAAKNGSPVSLTLHEPGGILRVESDPSGGQTLLYGQTRFIGQYTLVTAVQ